MTKMTPGQIRDIAEATWIIASDFASEHGTTTVRNGRSGTDVIVTGGTMRFVRKAAKELGMTAYLKEKWERAKVREYLKEGGNIVGVSGQLPGHPSHTYRIFVADVWKNGTARIEKEIIHKSYKVKETGQSPGGESGPVITSSLWDEFENSPLGEEQARFMAWLYAQGGKYTDSNGFMLTDVADSTSSAVRALQERGLLETKKKNQRRWHTIKFTPKGWWAAERLSYLQIGEVAVAAFLSKVGDFEGTTPSKTTRELAERVHKTVSTVGSALRSLIDAGLVEDERNVPEGPYTRVKWVGDKVPGVHIVAISRNERITTPNPEPPPAKEKPKLTMTGTAKVEVAKAEKAEPVTRSDIQDLIGHLERALEETSAPSGVVEAMATIHDTCKQVERGELSALRAIVNIEEASEPFIG